MIDDTGNDTRNSAIPVVFCADRRFCQHMAVTIASLLMNNAAHRFRLTAVFDERNDEAETRLSETVALFRNAEISFKTFGTNSFPHFRVDGQISLASYLRLYMTQFLPPDLDKVIYLDCDLVICDDVERLWNTDISGHFLAAVPDPYSDNHVTLGFREDEKYFNAGVLLVNLAKWREADVQPKLVAYAEGHTDILRYHDQCALNAVFRGQVLFLPYRWNFPARNADLPASAFGMTKEEFSRLRERPSIVHYTTHVKPWLYAQEPHYKPLYYHYLAFTPWSDFQPLDRNLRTALKKFVKMEKLKQVLKWRTPVFFRCLRQWLRLGDPFLRNVRG
jgi:lipopolysaccharide biosynthesis glycosyltransferase